MSKFLMVWEIPPFPAGSRELVSSSRSRRERRERDGNGNGGNSGHPWLELVAYCVLRYPLLRYRCNLVVMQQQFTVKLPEPPKFSGCMKDARPWLSTLKRFLNAAGFLEDHEAD